MIKTGACIETIMINRGYPSERSFIRQRKTLVCHISKWGKESPSIIVICVCVRADWDDAFLVEKVFSGHKKTTRSSEKPLGERCTMELWAFSGMWNILQA
jgi:hypothetical protein